MMPSVSVVAHTGDGLGVPSTGNAFMGAGMHIFRIADGQIAERWAEMDFTGLMHQIGALSSEAQADAHQA